VRGVVRIGVVLAVFGALAIAAIVLVSRGGGDERVDVPTYRVSTGEFRREVPADGNLKAVQATPVLAPQEARMALKVAWIVDDGARVSEGDVVIRFDPAEMKDRLRDGSDNTSQARKRIAMEQVTAGSSRRKRYRDAELAEKEMTAAKDFEYVDDDVFSRNEIVESRIDSELAAAKLDHARAAEGIERSVSGGKLDVLRVQERQAALQVSRAEKALELLEVTAPHGGIVLLHRDWRGRMMAVGDMVWPGQKIAEVPKDEAMEAEVFVLEADGGSLAPDMKAKVVLESQPGREFSARIKQVDTLAQPRIPEVPVQFFAVILTLDETEAATMKIGQRVRATILVEETEAVAVPRQAVFSRGSNNYVFRRSRAGFEKVDVELGAGTAGRVVVTQGLSDGDEIALRDPSGEMDSDSKADQDGDEAR